MSESLLWQRLEHLRPSLPRHIDIQRRHYGDELWYVLHDKSNGRFHRLSPSAYRLMALMDGRRSLRQILSAAAQPAQDETAEAPPTHGELIELLQYLHVADLLICDIPPNTRELFARQQQKSRQAWIRLLLNPLTWRVPLGNPDKFLNRLVPLGRLLASPAMGFVWLIVVGYSLLQAGNHWSELTRGQLDRLLSPANLLLLWLTYPLLKVVHEMGHGLFTKVWGGDVHEYGVVFVLATPLPYVDATAATAFPEKSRRLMVGAAGMAVELFLAAVALLVWLAIEPGLVRDLLYNIILIGSVSTVFFNGNPLMRFDGYHILCDALDTPNLATRANQQMSYLLQTWGYGVHGLHAPAATRREGVGLVLYSSAAFLYRLLVLVFIILLIAEHFPRAGLLLGAWLVFFQLLLPLGKHVRFLFKDQALAPTRRRSISVTLGAAVVLLAGFFYLPLPLSTRAEGVLWLPENAQVRAQSAGQVAQVLVNAGDPVAPGQVLVELHNPPLLAELAVKRAYLEEYRARYQQAWTDDRVQAQLYAEDIRAIEAELEHLQHRVDNLVIRSAVEGRFALTQRHSLVDHYLDQGDVIGLIIQDEPARIRAALTQQEVGLVRESTRAVEVRMTGEPGHWLQGEVGAEVPAATFNLPSPVLGSAGGGRLPVDAADNAGTKAAHMVFLVDVHVPGLARGSRYGERAHLLFRHPAEPLAARLQRHLRQLFITRIDL